MGRVTAHHQTAAQLGTLTGVELVDAFGHTGELTVSDVWAASVGMQNTDPLLDPIVEGDFIRFDVDGEPEFLMLIEVIDTTVIVPGEDHDEITVLSGSSVLGEWDNAVVLPPNGEDGRPHSETRLFDWSAKELDISGFPAAVMLTQAGQGSEGDPPPEFPVVWLRYPLGWSDPTGYWTWSEAAGAGPAMPAGDVYLFRDVNVPDAGYHSVYVAADNRHTTRIDGVTVARFDEEGSTGGYEVPLRADIYLTAGIHRSAIKASNDRADTLGGALFALWSQDVNRDDDTLILRLDDSWKAVGYPADAPGFTVGHVLRIFLEENQALGALSGWSLSCTDTHDSAGVLFPVDQEFAFRVGDKGLTVLRQLAATDIDFRPDPTDRILHVYNVDTMGVAEADATAVLHSLSRLKVVSRL